MIVLISLKNISVPFDKERLGRFKYFMIVGGKSVTCKFLEDKSAN